MQLISIDPGGILSPLLLAALQHLPARVGSMQSRSIDPSPCDTHPLPSVTAFTLRSSSSALAASNSTSSCLRCCSARSYSRG